MTTPSASEPAMTHRFFLSHAGIDTEAARMLKARLLAMAPGAQVWFDKDDLVAGRPWRPQLEAAIAASIAILVYVGSRGIVNWVEAEVDLGLGRATTEPAYPFIPVLSAMAPAADALPGFVSRFQGVQDVEGRPDQFAKLATALLGRSDTRLLEAEPFFGLKAVDEGRSHLFFGREEETDDLVARMRRLPLVLVTGDSGSGKSSLVRAGLVPKFRGGALALLGGELPEDRIWHVVTTRPRTRPRRELGEAVDAAAKHLGLPLADRGTLAAWAAKGSPDQVRRALRCDLPHDATRVLLVVDQLEELVTITPPAQRQPFVDLLLDLADPQDDRCRVVLTMRHDYVNLLAPFTALKARLDADGRQARCLLGRMSDAGLERIVTGPLRLAGVPSPEASLLARTVRDEVGQRPGDLALVEMALTETWRARGEHGGNLLAAYAAVGRVEGALAKAAEQVRHHLLDDAERALLDPVLIRLVRLGDTGGATRRVASRDELDDARWALLQKLAGEDGRRLVLIGGSDERPTAEIAHEALVTAWPHFQNLLQAIAPDKRTLDTLIPRAKAWAAAQEADRAHHLATGADLDLFAELADARPAWLSGDEAAFVAASAAARSIAEERQRTQALTAQRLAEAEAAQARLQAEQAEAARHAAEVLASERQRTTRAARRGAIAALALALLAAGFGVFFLLQKSRAAEQLARMQMQESLRLANLAEQELSADRPATAVLLALRGLPVSREHPERAWRAEAEQALYYPLLGLGKTEVLQGGSAASFSPDGTHVVTASDDGTARVWPVSKGWALVDWAKRAVPTTLSPEQEQHFYLENAGATDGSR